MSKFNWVEDALLFNLETGKVTLMSNNMPFSNIDPEMALKAAKSPFMEFHLSIPGVYIYTRETMERVERFEIWNRYKMRPDQIKLLVANEHPKYVLIPKINFEIKKNDGKES